MTIDKNDKRYAEYLSKRSRFRIFIRTFYLNNVLRFVRGATFDFGCGAGTLLRLLPDGSIGVDVNPDTVASCKESGLPVELYDTNDHYQFACIPQGKIKTFVSMHVFEHIENAQDSLRKTFDSCWRLGVERIIIVVPGVRGFASDGTHRTLIDREYMKKEGFFDHKKYRLIHAKYFPVDSERFSKIFVHNELVMVFDKK